MLVFLPQLCAAERGGFAFPPDWLDIARQIIVPFWALVAWVSTMPPVQRFGTPRAALAVLAGLIPATVIAPVSIR